VSASKRRPKADRFFYSGAAAVILVLSVIGFWPFYSRGLAFGDRTISPEILPLVRVHAAAMSAWVILFLVQSLLIRTRNHRLHMELGWSALVIASTIGITGALIAVRSVKADPDLQFWAMEYRQFLLVMLAEVGLYTSFVMAGLWFRKRPAIHRSMMLLASLSILAGATVRTPFFFPIFGVAGWMGIFGPIFALGVTSLLVRSLLNRVIDWPLAVGYATMVGVYVFAAEYALSDAWRQLANRLLHT